jgi:hypothetical protein
MILVGEDDDWTAAPPCHEFRANIRKKLPSWPILGHITTSMLPIAVKVRDGTATTATGTAHVGTNEPARQDAMARLPKWLEETH